MKFSTFSPKNTSESEWPEAWLMPESPKDLKVLNKMEPNIPATVEDLESFGVSYWKVGADSFSSELDIDAVTPPAPKHHRDYSFANLISLSPEHFPEYAADDIQSLFKERSLGGISCYVLVGSGFLDLRVSEDRWVRIQVQKGDLLTLPEDLYHRFTADDSEINTDTIKCFAGQPFWTPLVKIVLESRSPSSSRQ